MLHFHYADDPADLATLLQAGFQIQALVGCTLREFLCMEMEICGDYANKRIQTIFIDGKAVDDFDQAHVFPGTRLALSGAMPGLVGAVMRRGGALGGLRDSITYRADELRPVEKQGLVHIRLYNFIAEELAHIFLRRGVLIDAAKVSTFLSRRKAWLPGLKLENASGELEDLNPDAVRELLEQAEQVRITGRAA